MMASDVLNKLKWTGKLKGCEIVIRHRGAESDEKTISGSDVTEVKKSYFLYRNGKETFIPMHRILEVRAGGKVIWRKLQHKNVKKRD